MKRAVVIVGPTAVGKTNLGLNLAKKYNSVIISADSVQVFKNLDIISGKDIDTSKPKSENGFPVFVYENIPFYLLDIASPFSSFSVSQFQKIGLKVLEKTLLGGKLPFIVGGTGLYVKALVDGIPTSIVKPDIGLRLELEAYSLEDLQKRLIELNKKTFESMNESDRKNKRRLIRKIEIIKNGKFKTSNDKNEEEKIEFLQIGLQISREKIKENIDKRVDARIKNGAAGEAKELFKNYDKLTAQVKDANGYKQLFEYFLGKTSFEEAIHRWKISEYKHAKNQMTWFKKDSRVKWFEADRKDLFEKVGTKITEFLRT